MSLGSRSDFPPTRLCLKGFSINDFWGAVGTKPPGSPRCRPRGPREGGGGGSREKTQPRAQRQISQVCFWRHGVPVPKHRSLLENVWLVGLGAPGLKQNHSAKQTLIPLRNGSHILILGFSFDGGTEHATKRHSKLSSGLILVGFSAPCFEPGPSEGVLGPSFAGKPPNIFQN